jgi:hypothetical protein
MKPLLWMTAVSAISWLLVMAISEGRGHPEILAGMLGPLIVAGGSWIVYERTHRVAPARLTSVMIAAMAAKVLACGVYVAVVIGLADMRPVPFAVSFAGYFIVLYAMEALFLRRLLLVDLGSPGGEGGSTFGRM